jgi:hypothetical protein
MNIGLRVYAESAPDGKNDLEPLVSYIREEQIWFPGDQ